MELQGKRGQRWRKRQNSQENLATWKENTKKRRKTHGKPKKRKKFKKKTKRIPKLISRPFWNASHAVQTLVGCHFSYRQVTSELQTIVVMYIIRWVKTFKQVVRNRMLLGLLSRSCWLDCSKRMIRYCIEPIFRQGLDFCVPWVVYSRDPRVARLALGLEVGEGAIWRPSCASAAFSLKIHNMSFLELYIAMVYYMHPHIQKKPNGNITYTSLHKLIHKHHDNGCGLVSCWLVMIMDEVWCYAGECHPICIQQCISLTPKLM